MDLVKRLRADNAGRDPVRLAMKWAAMRGNPFAFLRGTCAVFYAQLPSAGVFKSAPLAWISGDLHLENFGSYKGDNRLVYFDVNDFDEAVLAPASWELVRTLTSIRVATQALDASFSQSRELAGVFLDAYAAALAAGKSYWIERETADGLILTLLDRLRERTRTAYLAQRTVVEGGRRRLRTDGVKALAATATERDSVTALLRTFAQTQAHPAVFQVLDVARRIAGTGSLGLDRYVVLIEGKGSPDGNDLLDLKEAAPSSLLVRLTQPQPVWASEADRVVTIQRRLQAVSMAFLHPVTMHGRSHVLRGLQPAEDRVALKRAAVSDGGLAQLLGTMGRLVAWSHLRSSGRQQSATADELIAFGQRMKWRRRLLEISEHCAQQCRADSAAFDKAVAAGAFAA